MKNLRSAIVVAFVLTASIALPAVEAAKPPSIIENGKARAERILSFSGITKEPGQFLPLNGKSVIMNQRDLEALWKAWKLGEPPRVDFATQVVTVATWSGSGPHMLRWLDDMGHLRVCCGGGTKDLVDGFTYVIEVYSLRGINTVNGQPWPEPAAAAND